MRLIIALVASLVLTHTASTAYAETITDTLPGNSTLPVDEAAGVESDDIATDDPLVDEDVTLPAGFALGTTSYTLDASGKPAYFAAGAPQQAASSGTWWDGVCTSGESRYAVVKDYPRTADHPRMERTYARMYCGKVHRNSEAPDSEAAFGIRHIRAFHADDFAKLAAWQGSTWGNWMHWALRWVMKEPTVRTVQNVKRFCYVKRFFFTDSSGETEVRYVVAILGKTGVRIMTAFPRKTTYCEGTVF